MRVRTVVAIVSLLPAALSAQRLPRTGRGPTTPAPLPPQAPEIAQVLAYRRSHLTVGTYPMVSFIQSPGFAGTPTSSWTAAGQGTRLDYEFTRFFSATLDITSSFLGGPASLQTGEVGARFHRERTESRFYPYLDLRGGYISSYMKSTSAILTDLTGFGSTGPADRMSHGFGAIAGIGTDFALTSSWALTTEGSVVRNNMTSRILRAGMPEQHSFGMTWYRFSLGLSYTAIRTIRQQAAETR
jgi:hypothetical protein